jgi:hypothetical protein
LLDHIKIKEDQKSSRHSTKEVTSIYLSPNIKWLKQHPAQCTKCHCQIPQVLKIRHLLLVLRPLQFHRERISLEISMMLIKMGEGSDTHGNEKIGLWDTKTQSLRNYCSY